MQGFIRRIDDLGRVVIPREVRQSLRIHEGDAFEIGTIEHNGRNAVVLSLYSPLADHYADDARKVITAASSTMANDIINTYVYDKYGAVVANVSRNSKVRRAEPSMVEAIVSYFECSGNRLLTDEAFAESNFGSNTREDHGFSFIAAPIRDKEGEVTGLVLSTSTATYRFTEREKAAIEMAGRSISIELQGN